MANSPFGTLYCYTREMTKKKKLCDVTDIITGAKCTRSKGHVERHSDESVDGIILSFNNAGTKKPEILTP